jgi:Uma2 family endonuclease
MATIDQSPPRTEAEASFFDEEGFPWLENGERMDQRTFHERYLRMPEGFKAELIDGVVYVMPSPLKIRHGRSDYTLSGWLFTYCVATPGTEGQNNTTAILGEKSEPQPDSALLILPEYGGQSRDGDDDFTYGAPELIVEVAYSSRSMDLNAKLRDYERAGVLEYIVYDLRNKAVRWHVLHEGRFEPLAPDADGLYRSRAFPGLWLDPAALASGDKAALIAALNRGLASPEHAAFVAELERRRADRAAGRPLSHR